MALLSPIQRSRANDSVHADLEHLGETGLDVEGGDLGDLGGGGEGGILGRDQVGGGGEGHCVRGRRGGGWIWGARREREEKSKEVRNVTGKINMATQDCLRLARPDSQSHRRDPLGGLRTLACRSVAILYLHTASPLVAIRQQQQR